MENSFRKKLLSGVKRIVIKIGSCVLAPHRDGLPERGLDMEAIGSLVRYIVELRRQGYEIILVSSGSILAGMMKLGLKEKPADLPLKQAVAAVGQMGLMGAYEKLFGEYGQQVGQVLLTWDDLENRHRYLNARHTIFKLLYYRVIPIINENDTVAVEEIKFGDNDNLSALVTRLVEADILIILSHVEGLYDEDPGHNKDAGLISDVERITPNIKQLVSSSQGKFSAGGMATKLAAAAFATALGIPAIVANGRREGILARIMAGDEVGTLFRPLPERIGRHKLWISQALRPRGEIVVDQGAKKALVASGRSLLPSGICGVGGKFDIGDAVSCLGPQGEEFARGLVNYDTREVEKIIGRKTRKIYWVINPMMK